MSQAWWKEAVVHHVWALNSNNGFRDKCKNLLALMQTAIDGLLFVYQGEELGMGKVRKSWEIEKEYKDIDSINLWERSKTLYGDALAIRREETDTG